MSVAWLVTGARGQVGSELVRILTGRRDDLTAWGRAELDLTDEDQVRTAVGEWLAGARTRRHAPVVVNTAAYTDVDGAESDEEAAALVNGAAPGWIAETLAGAGVGRLLHLSTDYVFDGTATSLYPVDAEPAPRSAYGRTKAAGERAVAAGADATTVRTAWVYDRTGKNFVTTMRRLAAERPTVSVVDDQVGALTWAVDLAAALVALGLRADAVPPVLHYTNSGSASWYEVARAVFEEIGADPGRVQPTTSAEMARPAPRPAYSVLDLSSWTAAGLPEPRPWRSALNQALNSAT